MAFGRLIQKEVYIRLTDSGTAFMCTVQYGFYSRVGSGPDPLPKGGRVSCEQPTRDVLTPDSLPDACEVPYPARDIGARSAECQAR